MPGTEYVWNEPDHSISIHLPLVLVSRLGLEALEAYKSVPKRGLEIGGLLLGRAEGTALYISDFQPVESEYRWGPSYRLSDSDLKTFEEAIGQHPDAIGMYRTSTQTDALSLEEDHVKLFRRYFAGAGKVYLLVQPKRGNAVFFVNDGETLTAGHEFPFRASELSVEIPETTLKPDRPPEPKLEPKPVRSLAVLPKAPLPAPPAPPAGRPRTRLVQAAALVFGMLAGAAIYQVLHSASRPSPNVAPLSPVATATKGDPKPSAAPHMPLSVQWAGNSVMLYWNPDNTLIRSADKATLFISDGDQQRELALDHGDLASGALSYRPRSGEVTFRLRIFGGGLPTDESIKVVGSLPSQPAPPEREARKEEKPAETPEPAQAAPNQGTASREAQPPQPAEPRPSPFTPVPKTMIAAAPAVPPVVAAPPAPTRTPEPEVTIRVEPTGKSKLSHVVGHIPLLKRLNKQSFVPPTPVHEVHPVLTARERKALVDNVPIDIKVMVGKTGKVEDVEMMGHAERQPLFAELALSAARRWEFAPAHVGEEKMQGEVILHFTFLMTPPPPATDSSRSNSGGH